MTDFHSFILNRRSAGARDLVAPGPDAATIRAIAAAAAQAPDHGRLVPFRLVQIENRARFADILGAATRETDLSTSATEIERAREKAHQGPCLIGLIARIAPDHPKIPASDQWLTVGAALENMLLALEATPFRAAVRSGRYLDTNAVRDGFGLHEHEQMCCFLAIGTATAMPPAKPKPTVDSLLTVWQG